MSWSPVYRLVKKIPRGRVTTYGELARALALPGGARAIGYAMAACPSGQGIPWHRVVGAGERITIPEPHAILQRRLLESEGIAVEGKRIIGMESHVWKPSHKKAAGKTGKKRGRSGDSQPKRDCDRSILHIAKGLIRGPSHHPGGKSL